MLMFAEPKAVALQARFFRGFSDPSRLAILEALRAGPMTVGDIVEATRLGQSNVSNHLSCLRDCGLVVVEQQGRYNIYALSDPRVDQLMRLADELIADVAHGVYTCTRLRALSEGQANDAAHN